MEVDLSRLPAGVRRKMDEIFRTDFDLKVLKAIERQTRTAKARENGLRWRDDFVPQFEIDPMVDSIWRQFYGHNYTENPDLMRFLQARNPEIKIRARSGKIQVGYTRAAVAEGKRGKGEKGKCSSAPFPLCSSAKRRFRFGPGTLQLAK